MPSPLAVIVFWAAVLCCVVAEVAIVRSTALARGGPEPDAAGHRLPPVRRGTEVMWAVLPALGLVGVLAWTWREMHAPAADAPSPAASAPAPASAAPARGAPAVP